MHFYFSATEFEYSNFFSCLVKEYKLKTDCKYGQYCTPLSQSNCRYFFVLVIIENTVPKKVFFIVLLYLVMSSLGLRTLLQESINSNISFCQMKFFLKLSTRLANFFRFKDKIPFCLRSNIVYELAWGRCNATYYGKTCRPFRVTVGEHSGTFNKQTVQIKKINRR